MFSTTGKYVGQPEFFFFFLPSSLDMLSFEISDKEKIIYEAFNLKVCVNSLYFCIKFVKLVLLFMLKEIGLQILFQTLNMNHLNGFDYKQWQLLVTLTTNCHCLQSVWLPIPPTLFVWGNNTKSTFPVILCFCFGNITAVTLICIKHLQK